MNQNTTSDNVEIVAYSGRVNAPPGFDKGGMDVTAIAYWAKVGDVWYRWDGRNSVLLKEAIAAANCFTANEWLETLGDELMKWEFQAQ